MAERLLTAPEIDKLLSIFRGGREPLKHDVEIENFDVNQPSRVPRGALSALKIRHQEAAGSIVQDLKLLLEGNALVSLIGFDQVVFEPWRARLADPCLAFIVEMSPLSEPGILLLDHGLAFAVIDRLLGGTGKTKVDDRDLTTTEAGVLEEFLDPIVSAHVKAWQPYTKLVGKIKRPVFVPRFLRDIPDKEVVLSASYRMELLGEAWQFQFALPVTGLEPHLQHEPRRNLGEADRNEIRQQMANQLAQVDVNLAIKLGESELLLSELLDLEAGDTVILGKRIRDPLDLMVEGEPQLKGYMRRQGRRLVFQTLEPKQAAPENHSEQQDPHQAGVGQGDNS